MPYLNPILGAIVLLFGRPLYWAFIAIAGFLLGARLADALLVDATPTAELVVAIVAGVIGALVAMLAQRVAFAFAGFYAGGYLAIQLATAWPSGAGELVWFVIGGVLGAIMAWILMDWAIIILSSLVGARAIVAAFALAPGTETLLFVVLVAIGIVFQSRGLAGREE